MPDTFQLEIVTPEKKVVDTTAEEVQIPGKNGYLGVLPGHAPLITELSVGEITYRENATEQKLAVAWGFAEVLPDKVTILAETAERPSKSMSNAHAKPKSVPNNASPAVILRWTWIALSTPSTAPKPASTSPQVNSSSSS